MKLAVTHSTVPQDLNAGYDYSRHKAEFLDVIEQLCRDEELNQYSPQSIIDALLCVDMLEINTVMETKTAAKKILTNNEYHPQHIVAAFSTRALYNYAHKAGKNVREAYHDFLVFDIYTTIYDLYIILHTQTINAAGLFSQNRINACTKFRERFSLPVVTCGVDSQLVQLAPDAQGYDWKNVGTHISSITSEIFTAYDTLLPTEIVSLIALTVAIEHDSIKDVINNIPLDSVLEERSMRAKKIFELFIDSRQKEGDAFSFKSWFSDVSNIGVLPLVSCATPEKMKKIESVIEKIHSERELERALIDTKLEEESKYANIE